MSNRDVIGKQLFETMIQIKILMEQCCEGSFDDHVASILQFQALRLVSRSNNATNSELAQFLRVSPSSAAQLTDRLEKAGLLTREQDKKDRRMVRLSLTKKGFEELEYLKDKMYREVSQVFSCLSEKDLREFFRIHTELLKGLEAKINTT